MESLAQLEALCERLYNSQDSAERAHAESTLQCFSVNTEYISQCQFILDNALSPYALVLASSSLLKQVTEHSLSLQLRLDIRNYVVGYLATRGPELQPYVTGSLIQLLCRVTKLGWYDDDRFREIVKESMDFLSQSTTGHYFIGLKILNQIVAEMNQPNPGFPLTHHRKIACSFRDLALFQIFQISITSLQQLKNDIDKKLKEQALSLALKCLSFDFVGTSLDESSEDLGTVQIPSSWRPILEDSSTLQLFFDYYAISKPPLSKEVLECLVRLASVRRSLFSNDTERSKFLAHLMTGTKEILQTGQGLADHDNYHEYCRLLGRFKVNYQLSELVNVEGYSDWIRLVAEFTLKSLQSWQWASSSVYYLLGLWSRLVTSVPYLKSDMPSLLDEFVPKITEGFITSRFDCVQAILPDDLSEDPLDNVELLQDQLDNFPYICRFQYEASSLYIIKLLEPILQTYTEGTRLPTSGDSNELSIVEGQLAWIVHIIASIIKFKPSTSCSAEPHEIIDAELAARVFQLINISDTGSHVQVHGNVCLESVVVTPTLDWKLHAFDVLSEFDGSNESAAGPMLQFEWLVGAQYKAVELLKNDWVTIRKSPAWAVDSWGLGCLIFELFSATKLSKTEELRNTGSIPKSLLPDYQRLLSSTPSRRLNAAKLIENSEYFHNKLVETIQFMDVLNLKDSVEKDSFFRKLPNLAEQLPRQIVLKKLLPMLASSLEFGSAAAPALNSLLKMGSWLSEDEFGSKVLPTLVKLFSSNDRAIRVGLLQHIDQYGVSLSTQIVDEQVYPHVATGFSDSSAVLRELTLKSMLVLAPKLSQRTITGSLLKYLSKLQVDEEPAIRTNTTILLGNIAGYLNEGTRRRVLINAFTVRALRDTFSPARAAGVMALSATSAYYDPSEVATRILPNVVVLTVDPDSEVRSKAFEAIHLFLQIMKQHHEKVNINGSSTDNGVSPAIGSGSLLGWAMSSLTLKAKGSEQALVSSSNSVVAPADHSTLSSNISASNVSETQGTHLPSLANHVDHPTPSSPTSTDGWGDIDENGRQEEESDKDGWDDIEVIEEKKPAAALANIHAAQQRPVVNTRLQGANSLPSKQLSRPAKDVNKLSDDDDPWAAIAAPPPTTKVKSLAATSASSWNNEDDPWAAIAAPQPSTTVRPLSATTTSRSRPVSETGNRANSTNLHSSGSGRGRGTKAAPMKLGAQRLNRNTDL